MVSQNILVGQLPASDLALLTPHLRRVNLYQGDRLSMVGQRIEDICFPEGAVVSIADRLPDGAAVEIGIIGICGMVGWPLLLGVRTCVHDITVQVGGGTALKIDADHLEEACRRSRDLNSRLLRFVHVLTIQMARAITSNLRDPAEKRLARWLLMCHDRLSGDDLPLTHHFIGTALGVRRATVTDSLHLLEGAGALRSTRNLITVRDRQLLETIAGDSYGYAESQYRHLVGPFGKSAPATTIDPVQV